MTLGTTYELFVSLVVFVHVFLLKMFSIIDNRVSLVWKTENSNQFISNEWFSSQHLDNNENRPPQCHKRKIRPQLIISWKFSSLVLVRHFNSLKFIFITGRGWRRASESEVLLSVLLKITSNSSSSCARIHLVFRDRESTLQCDVWTKHHAGHYENFEEFREIRIAG